MWVLWNVDDIKISEAWVILIFKHRTVSLVTETHLQEIYNCHIIPLSWKILHTEPGIQSALCLLPI